ncbi:MAG: methyl-accepting chemotaxis protein [Treponema sp.]|nr:methyl-accepting chemotaxis protein [Treponema sp.]
MTRTEVNNILKHDEFIGEKLICRFRMVLAVIFFSSVPVVSFMRTMNNENAFPPQAYICCSSFFIYSIFIYFYLRKKESVHESFKYICVIIDMVMHTASIWIGCTYPHIAPAITYLSTWALFFMVLIMVGAFRYSVPCAYFSGIFAGLCYLLVVMVNGKNLDLPYYFYFENQTINVSFPVFNEFFRVISMIIIGVITGMACKRHLKHFNSMLETQSEAAETASKTVEQTRGITQVIQKSTADIFHSSQDIFSTANNQAASIQEIESTINENSQIAEEIAHKISEVAVIASKMKNDVDEGFSVLESNVDQMVDIKEKNDGFISGIIDLGNKITRIRDIINSINDITDQTKVIAFNATLEATNAGERGKRFEVVASEVNRLADDITGLTKQINKNIEELEYSSSNLVASSEESFGKISEGNSLIQELENIFLEIKNRAETTSNQAHTITISTQKQLKSSEQINIAIADISKGLSNFILSTKIATSSAENLSKMTTKLGNLLADNEPDEALE